MNPEIKKLSDKDVSEFSELVQVFETVFEWETPTLPTQTHLQKVLSNSQFIAFVANVNDQVIGGLTAHILDRYDLDKPSAYVYDLAVLSKYQRMGIGKKLMSALTDYCSKKGFADVFVQAETEDVHAVNFYRTTPVIEELQATQFTYSFDNNCK